MVLKKTRNCSKISMKKYHDRPTFGARSGALMLCLGSANRANPPPRAGLGASSESEAGQGPSTV